MHTFINDDGEMIEQMLLVDGDNHGHNTGKVFVERHVNNLVALRDATCKDIIGNWKRIVEIEGADVSAYEGFYEDLELVFNWANIRSDLTDNLFNVSWDDGNIIAWRVMPDESDESED